MEEFKKRILLIGPIGDFGGRELESGFIASVLCQNNDVSICTTGKLTPKSQVFEFNKNQKVFSLKDLVYKKFKSLRVLAFISYLKNKKKENQSYYVNNLWAKKYFDYDKKIKCILTEIIEDYDLIFINAQLSSNYVKYIIEKSKKLNKKLVFRTTGTIQKDQNFSFLNHVDLFIHHSENNANKLEIDKHNYTIIDQCAFNEDKLLKISLMDSKVNYFLVIGRLEKEKNIENVIQSFLNVKSTGDILYIVGEGAELNNLIAIANKDSSIIFSGFIPNNNLQEYFAKVDCVIISSTEESGPLTGIESMAAGRLLISTKVGAMPERLNGISVLWFDNSVKSLSQQMLKIKKLNNQETFDISNKIRNRYLQEYSKDIIALKYQHAINKLFNANRV
ncbi:glycosyltransferase family 4 protein [Flavobacterium flavigenum]|uniref:glycosyltransferase family 4 protein n=1 Tax=Flavobacterium flavigenum TaxID=3003258 RepID=UPI002482C13C|nr:glycosyltransferase [Flavobacterium flavigenum]